MIDDLIKALENKYCYGENAIQIKNNNFDYLSVYDKNLNDSSSAVKNHYNIFATRGNSIIYLTYDGRANRGKILEVISSKFTMIENYLCI